MIELTMSADQIVSPGQQIIFNCVKMHTGNGEGYVDGSSAVKLRANGGIYEVHFSANVTCEDPETPVKLAIISDENYIPESCMFSTPCRSGVLNNVAKTVPVKNSSHNIIAVINAGTSTVVVGPHPTLYIKRVS